MLKPGYLNCIMVVYKQIEPRIVNNNANPVLFYGQNVNVFYMLN